MSLGRVSTFLDIYLERDLATGVLDETGRRRLMDHFVMKLRMARHLRTPDYNELFGGDPMWITEAVGGMGEDGRTWSPKIPSGCCNTLYTLGPRPEPNLTVLWAEGLPEGFKRFCAKVSMRHRRDPVRERRPDAPHLWGRLRHRLLRFRHAGGQADAVLRRAVQPAQAAAAGPQRRLRHQGSGMQVGPQMGPL